MKKIFVLYTGGTIGMVQGAHGLQPNAQLVETALTPFVHQMHLTWHICQPLIDSSAVSPHDWINWLTILNAQLPHYDGVLILHGTDTMAYTANILALTVNTLGKPIVLTGSQKPFGAPDSDAPFNLQTAMVALQRDDLKEVVLAFYGKLFPAIGSSKISTQSDDGFDNPHFGQWKAQSIAPFSSHLARHLNADKTIFPMYFTPSSSISAFAQCLRHVCADAIILQTFGHGNAPSDTDFIAAIQQWISQGKYVLNISQVAQGCAASVYAQGEALRQAGVINGGKCNIETATALMLLASSNAWTTADICAELQRLNLL